MSNNDPNQSGGNYYSPSHSKYNSNNRSRRRHNNNNPYDPKQSRSWRKENSYRNNAPQRQSRLRPGDRQAKRGSRLPKRGGNIEEKRKSRSPSPFCGTEQYILNKIQENCNLIKQQLLNPGLSIAKPVTTENTTPQETYSGEARNQENFKKYSLPAASTPKPSTKTSKKLEQIQTQILDHITNLSARKKFNLISGCSSSEYDPAIEQIQKQKRLELSKALRDMFAQENLQEDVFINTISPDIKIKLEQLPLQFMQQLSATLNIDLNEIMLDDSNIDGMNQDSFRVKEEIVEIADEQEPSSRDQKFDLTNYHLNVTPCKSEMIDVEESLLDDNDEIVLSDDQMIGSDLELEEEHHSKINSIRVRSEFNENNVDQSSAMNSTEITTTKKRINTHIFFDDEEAEIVETKPALNSIELRPTLKLKETKSQINSPIEIRPTFNTVETQTTISNNDLSIEFKLNTRPQSLNEALDAMFKIDNEIERLVKLRQSIFVQLNESQSNTHSLCNPQQSTSLIDMQQTNLSGRLYDKPLEFAQMKEKILTMRKTGNILVAGSESGYIFEINLTTGQTLLSKRISLLPITCTLLNKSNLFIGSFDNELRKYLYPTLNKKQSFSLPDGIQCMTFAWRCLFIGGVHGYLIRFNTVKNKIHFQDQIYTDSILVLLATMEGGRKVLLVGAKNSPVCIRDALSGLRMRIMDDVLSPTVYSLLMNGSFVYCGTPSHDILVYKFHDGSLVEKFSASNCKGIGCMKLYHNLLFAGCYDGNIYVYDTKTNKFFGQFPGPGGAILSMQIVGNLIFIGTLTNNFKSVLIPPNIVEEANIFTGKMHSLFVKLFKPIRSH